ncbi:hypothetical protein P3T76_010547 [Phytophthora citrophthora]|uniref:Uncharacterized protein n=1 Tax=Phytophthora citrophthora TaxID=4793 RepID=A0AAD9GC50_9STRA|nr:hypothetical protein P3T76_010547 [Phytophthora citrophthora]
MEPAGVEATDVPGTFTWSSPSAASTPCFGAADALDCEAGALELPPDVTAPPPSSPQDATVVEAGPVTEASPVVEAVGEPMVVGSSSDMLVRKEIGM